VISTTLVPFCNTYLAPDSISPFATVHDWVSQFMAAKAMAPELKTSTIRWMGERIQCGRHVICLHRFRMFLQNRMKSMWLRINQEVLLGIDLSALGIKVDLFPRLVDGSVVGSGPFSQGWSILLDSGDSIKLQEALAGAENSFLTSPIDISKAEEWVKSIHMVWQELFCLIHILCGPFPLFFLEHLEILYSNSTTRRGDFFLVDGNLAIMTSFEGERHNMIGSYKRRFRLLPHRLSVALAVMLQLVRPAELSVLLSTPGTPTNKEKMLCDYRHTLYVSHGLKWNLDMLSTIWSPWITEGMGFFLKAHSYRAFCKAWRTKHKTVSNTAWLGKMADAQAGHGPDVSDKLYGKLDNIGGLATAKTLLEKEQCLDWHKWLGF